MSNDSEFDPVDWFQRHAKMPSMAHTFAASLCALAAESAKRQAMKDAGICREQQEDWIPGLRGNSMEDHARESCARAIEREINKT